MRIASKLAALLLMLFAAACDESPVALPEAASVAVAGSSMSMLVGDAAPVAAQVLDGQGRVMQELTPVFSTDNPSVATVGADGTVRALSPGTANVTAAYGGTSATVKVTVAADRRGDLQNLTVLADSVVADRRAGVQAVAFRGMNGYGQPVCPQLSLRSSDPSVATARMGGTCRIEIVPAIAGTTTITVEADGRTDTFLVRVTSTGATSFFSARPTSEELVAGATVSYTVKVLDQTSRPVAGQAVNFEVGVGSLSATTVVTGEDGTATVQWQIPTDLREWGQTSWISYRTTHQNGAVGGRTEDVFINGASLAEIILYSSSGSGSTLTRVTADSLVAPGYSYVDVAASGLDQYGNVRAVDFTFSAAGGSQYWSWSCGGPAGTRLSSGLEYTCIYSYPGAVTVTARAPNGVQRSVRIRFTS